MKRMIASIVFLGFIVLPVFGVAGETQVFKTSKGIQGWLVEEHHLPIVSISFAWRGGVERDDDAKQGLGRIAATMLTKGAGKDDERAFQRKLQEHAISLGFEAQRDTVYGHVRCLKETLPIVIEMVKASVMDPRFDESSLSRVKAEALSELNNVQSDPEWMLSRLMMREVFSGHPYSKRSLGTQSTLASITRDDLIQWQKTLHRENLVVSIAGDVTRYEASALLDDMLGDLSGASSQTDIPDAVLKGRQQVFVANYNGSQTSMMVLWPGMARHDKEWYAVQVMNYIFGGGSFSSRLMNEIREKRGLTYGISSGMSVYDHATLYSVHASFKNEHAGEVLNLVRKEIFRLRDTPVSTQELKAAKDYLTGSYGLGLTSTARVAGHMLELQRQKLSVTDQHDSEVGIMAVTADDVQRVAKRIFQDDLMAVFFVGQPKGITATQTFSDIE